MSNDEQIILTAIFQSARTTIDGGIRITFDIDGSQSDLLSKLLKLKDQALFVVVTPKPDSI